MIKLCASLINKCVQCAIIESILYFCKLIKTRILVIINYLDIDL